MIVKQSFRFEAAHSLPRYAGRCFNLHGHSYKCTIMLDLPVDPRTGMTRDFYEIEGVVEAVLQGWDHRNLNEVLENPTAENIVIEIWNQLTSKLPGLLEIELWETPDSSVVYRGERSR
jgi:6-pyruvoyltetrahydropterin/6-carboxytetrahydropterin synthase